MRRFVSGTSPAMIVALLALFVSLGGVSWAVATGSIDSREIKNGSVQSRDVRDGSLQGRDVANGSVQSREVRDGALRGVDVNDGSLGGVDLASNTLGDREIDETKLDIGRLGGVDVKRFVRGVRRVMSGTANDPVSPKVAPPARCPAGKRLLGGGARVVAPPGTPVAVSTSAPSGDAWEAQAYATAPTANWQLVAVAICG
jgi:hypothetical protein